MTRSQWTSSKVWMLLICLAHGTGTAASANAPGTSRGIIYVADGAGGQGAIVDGIANNIYKARVPLTVQQVNWTTLSQAEDFQSQYNATVKGRHLAHKIVEMRRHCPDAKIFLVGFGAGTNIILKAVDCLPPNSVTRIILLAPTVSCMYDLRRALSASCEGVDVIYTPNDMLLQCAIKKYGTSDVGIKGATKAAGLNGFHVRIGSSQDAALFSKFRQERLVINNPCEGCGGNHLDVGHDGHVGYACPYFLRSRVIALIESSLLNPRPCTCPPPVPMPTPPHHNPPAPYHPPVPQTHVPTYPPTQVPYYPPAPAPQYPPTQVPYYYPPAPQYPLPQAYYPQYPQQAPYYPPVPQYPPQTQPPVPAPQYPPQAPVPQYPPQTKPSIPAPQYPQTTIPPAPAPQYPRIVDVPQQQTPTAQSSTYRPSPYTYGQSSQR